MSIFAIPKGFFQQFINNFMIRYKETRSFPVN